MTVSRRSSTPERGGQPGLGPHGDRWGQGLGQRRRGRMLCGRDAPVDNFGIVSNGPDRRYGTDDDLRTATSEGLAAQDPTNADWQRDLSVSHDRWRS